MQKNELKKVKKIILYYIYWTHELCELIPNIKNICKIKPPNGFCFCKHIIQFNVASTRHRLQRKFVCFPSNLSDVNARVFSIKTFKLNTFKNLFLFLRQCYVKRPWHANLFIFMIYRKRYESSNVVLRASLKWNETIKYNNQS